jgi:glycosyltransferase involved in cell wall biosynthesis
MIDLSVIIPAFNEEKHLERCIRSVKECANQIFVIDSFSSDQTVNIARSLEVTLVQRKWKNYADQFQWGLDQMNPKAGWVMRLDADEYLEPSLINEIKEVLPRIPAEISGIYIKRKVFFQGQWIKHGGFYPHTLLRIWRTGQGRIEQRWMDEHIVLPPEAGTMTLNAHLIDDNQKGITFWVDKHNRYATREAADLLIQKYFPHHGDDALRQMAADPQARWKRILKDQVYGKLPPGLRAALYFFYRYFLRLGFLDGGRGFIWHFFQGFWYRLLVDVKVREIEQKSAGNSQTIREILLEEHGIEI